jgi:polysaccharide biosynthesis/export protein
MSRYRCLVCLLLLPLIISCSSKKIPEDVIVNREEAAPKAPFALGVGDEISFSVWRHDDLTRTLQIDPAGDISLPLIGQLKASGLTIAQLREQIHERLSKYIVNPKVDVSLTDLASQNVYVLGEVNATGTFTLDRDMLVWDAISLAGGFTQDANQEAVLLVRGENGIARISALDLDIQDIFKKGKGVPDYRLRSRDLIYVPPSKIADVERFMLRLSNILSPLLNIERGIIMSQDVRNVLKGQDIKGGVIY